MAEKMPLSILISTMIGCIAFVSVNSATTHIVGDNFGWNTPPYHGFFDNWTKNRTFSVGDTLLFNYNPGMSTVVQVNKDDYDHCTIKDTIYTYFRGNSSVTLDKPGEYYFFCSVGKRCETGQKLWVKVQ